jgi:hypothetical protein
MSQVLHVNVTRRDAETTQTTQPISLEADLAAARQLAELLDAKFTVGGVRFGVDAILGLIPVVGDTVSTLIGVYPLMLARKHKLGRWVQARMAANLAADWAIGLVPLAGDVFDIGFKANLRNFALLEKAAITHRRR